MRWLARWFVVALLGCGTGLHSTRKPQLAGSDVDFCAIAAAALDVSIRPFTEGSLAMDSQCVMDYTSRNRRIYVDARFTAGDHLEGTTTPICVTDRYVVRFDPEHFEPSPAGGVLLLLFGRTADGTRDFGVSVERPDWPQHRPGNLALSPCESSFGVVRQTPSGWKAEVLPPPHSPDAL